MQHPLPFLPLSRPGPEIGKRLILPRAVALFYGGFGWMNILAGSLAPHLDANLLWIDLRFVPAVLAQMLIASCSTALVAFAIVPRCRAWRRNVTVAAALTLAAAALVNGVQFYVVWARGGIRPEIPAPLSLLSLVLLGCVGLSLLRSVSARGQLKQLALVVATAAACALAFPLLQMFFFGKTDYRRTGDVAVVFGARAYADGRPSDALADRVRTACGLYREGEVKKLIFSGGPGDGAVHETESMRRMAVRLGVDPGDIVVDTAGLNTRATARNTESMFQALGVRRVLVVSHFYHLPRIKLSYQRDGFEVYTVPAKESYLLRQLPFNMLREVAAFWAYYFQPLPGAIRKHV